MGKRRKHARQSTMWVATTDLPKSAGHPFYERLNRVLVDAGFDAFVEAECAPFYADGIGRPGLAPGRYFRLLLLGYFEGLDSERAIAWRAADSLSIRPSWTSRWRRSAGPFDPGRAPDDVEPRGVHVGWQTPTFRGTPWGSTRRRGGECTAASCAGTQATRTRRG